MQNWERQKFEDNWKSAFEGAEMPAPDAVWKSIEIELSGEETNKMKRRVMFYQVLAAAMVIFGLLSGIYAFYGTSKRDTQMPSANSSAEPADTQSNPPIISNEINPENAITKVPPNQNVSAVSSSETVKSQGPSQNLARRPEVSEITTVFSQENETPVNSGMMSPSLTSPDSLTIESKEMVAQSFIYQDGVGDDLPQEKKEAIAEPEVKADVLLSAEQINAIAETQNNKKEKAQPEGLWLGMGAAAGNYNPEGVQASSMRAADASPNIPQSGVSSSPQSRQNSAGSSYSFGLAVGKKISKKWIIQSGINYISQQIDYTSNFADISSSNQARASVAEYFDASNNYGAVSMTTPSPLSPTTHSITTPYTVNSNIEIVSVPIQAGYLFVDRKLGFQLNAGVSSDFFVRNTLVDKSGGVSKFSQGAGEDSPYRSMILSGLLSTELSYKVGIHYRLSLVPGIRYSFQSALKDRTGTGTPLVLDVGFRFKYIFK